MNKDALIQKYLDSELSESEQVEFNNLLQNDPEVYRLVAGLDKINKNLNSIPTEFTINDIAFINSTRDGLTSISKPGVSPDKKSVAPRTYRKYAIYSILSLLLITLISYSIYQLRDNQKNVSDSQQATKTIESKNNPLTARNEINNSNSERSITTTKSKVQLKDNSKKTASNFEANSKINETTQNEVNISIRDNNQKTIQETLNQLKVDFEKFRTSGDFLNSANTAKRIGNIYINIYQDFSGGLSYLYKSIELAKRTNNNQFYSELLFETGKTEISAGNSEKGKLLIEQAIKLISDENPEKAAIWKDYLKNN